MRGELEAEQNCNILTPTLMAITAFLSRSPGLLNREPGVQPLWDMFLIPASSLQLIWSPTDLNFLSPGLYNNLTPTLLPASVTILHSIQPVHGQGYILIFLDRMHLLFTQVHFRFWQLCRGSICYIERDKTKYSRHRKKGTNEFWFSHDQWRHTSKRKEGKFL